MWTTAQFREMEHSKEVRARIMVNKKSIDAIYTEKIAVERRKGRRKGSTKKQPKVSYEWATREYLRRVSVQRIYCWNPLIW